MRAHVRYAVAALLVVILTVLAGCQGDERLFGPPPGQRTVDAADDVLTADNIAQAAEQESWVVSLGPVMAATFSPTDDRIATMGADRIVRLWDASTGRLLDELHEHNAVGTGLAYSPDGSQLVSGGSAVGQDTRLWDLETKQTLATTSMDGYFVFDVAWSPDGKQFALVSRGSSRVYIYETKHLNVIQRRPSGIPNNAIAHGDEYLAITNNIGSTYIYSYQDPAAYALLHEKRYDVKIDRPAEDDVPGSDLEFSRGDELLANCYRNGVVEIWRSSDWGLVSTFDAHEFVKDEVLGCRDGIFLYAGDVYMSVGDDGYLRAWAPRTGEMLGEWDFGQPARTVSLSAGGERLAVGLEDGSLRVFGLPEVRTAEE